MGQRAKAPAPVGVIGKNELPRAPVVKKERRQGTGVLPPQKPKRKPRNKTKVPDRPDYALAAVANWRNACIERDQLLARAKRVRWLAIMEMRAAGVTWRDVGVITGLSLHYMRNTYCKLGLRAAEQTRRLQLYPALHGRAWRRRVSQATIDANRARSDAAKTRIVRYHADRDLIPFLEDLGGPYLEEVAGGG